jgi:pentose-5-phosphate-3-epimerase
MKMRLSLLALITCLGVSLTAHASDITFDITDGTFSPSGTFSGWFLGRVHTTVNLC